MQHVLRAFSGRTEPHDSVEGILRHLVAVIVCGLSGSVRKKDILHVDAMVFGDVLELRPNVAETP